MRVLISVQDNEFEFSLYPMGTRFNRIAGVYCFFIVPSQFSPINSTIETYSLLYLGITNNLQSRLTNHHKMEQAVSMGLTHIGILKMRSGRKRKSAERVLLKGFNPPLNQTWVIDLIMYVSTGSA